MSDPLSSNTQAILLLTAPLLGSRGGEASPQPLTPGEYKKLARFLRAKQRQPADLLGPDADSVLNQRDTPIEGERLRRLLSRGFLLSQATERWQTRAIWVVSRADPSYPRRLKALLKEDAPPLLYGCGDAAILESGGLAIVGSRHVDESLLEYTAGVARLVAEAGQTVVSGGARGIDQAAMHGALGAGGRVVGVLPDSLEQTALNREHRNLLLAGQLVLLSPYDPSAGFHVGHAMQRNKLIYALADAALVVHSDYEKGGTWAGAVEQLESLRLGTVYVRVTGRSEGLLALRRKGALPWPEPATADELLDVLAPPAADELSGKAMSFLATQPPAVHSSAMLFDAPSAEESPLVMHGAAADDLFAKVTLLLRRMILPRTEAEVASELNVTSAQARMWLDRLVGEGVMRKLGRPTRYCAVTPSRSRETLFGESLDVDGLPDEGEP
ncbi:MAG: protecting protein DprA [Acidobacteria bacterium]|nr:protecting protein DprA [Acidobacteriota bacterium]